MEDLHPFPRMELDERIVHSLSWTVHFPQPQGEVDILLGVADSLRLLKKKTYIPKEGFCFAVHSLQIRALWKSTSKGF